MRRELIIFAKYPEPGRVKTRLAKKIGSERAASLYKEMAETVVLKTAPVGEKYRQVLFFDPPEREADFRRWFPGLDLCPQVSGDLGARMEAAFRESFDAGAGGVVLIGTDCPDLDHDLVIQAFQKMAGSDLVIGPATDGGYYLIGMKNLRGEIFTGIPWSTNRVLSMTLQRAEEAGLRVALLPTLSDIDEIS